MDKMLYFTTPLYYVNDKPHIGHSYTTVICDTYTRYHRFRGDSVFFLTGTDEHGGKIEKTALEKGSEVLAYVDSIVGDFQALWKELGIEYDDFIRTTETRHKEVVKKVLETLQAKGDIYKSKYKGWYCTPCESFWKVSELIEDNCPDCGRSVQEIEEENYFFKLAQHQEWLINYINEKPEFVFPESRKREILAFLDNPLEDLCISRPKARLEWGIAFPGAQEHVVYVWFDALLNYVSAVGYLADDELFKALWPASVHFVGKDILRQHTVYWPIMLKAMGLEIPQRVIAHGWWKMGGEKVSKTRGNIVDPLEIIQKYGVDCFRYFLMREVTLGLDGSYSEDMLLHRFNNDLANDLGNLVHRSSGMLGKYFEGIIPEPGELGPLPQALRDQGAGLWAAVDQAMLTFDTRRSLELIWEFIRAANKFVEDTKPWALAKAPEKEAELRQVMYTLFESLRVIGLILTPFMPSTAEKIQRFLQIEGQAAASALTTWGILEPGKKMGHSEPLFPKEEVQPS